MCGYPMLDICIQGLIDQGVVATLSDFWAHLPRFWLLLMFTSSSS